MPCITYQSPLNPSGFGQFTVRMATVGRLLYIACGRLKHEQKVKNINRTCCRFVL